MKNKGFTLIELLGVISVLAIILVLAITALTTTLEKTEENELEQFNNTIKNAAELYVTSNRLTITQDYMITVQILIQEGFIDDDLIDPTTEVEIKNSDQVKVNKNSDGIFVYEYIRN